MGEELFGQPENFLSSPPRIYGVRGEDIFVAGVIQTRKPIMFKLIKIPTTTRMQIRLFLKHKLKKWRKNKKTGLETRKNMSVHTHIYECSHVFPHMRTDRENWNIQQRRLGVSHSKWSLASCSQIKSYRAEWKYTTKSLIKSRWHENLWFFFLINCCTRFAMIT